jgi:hypothetical protein
MFISHLLNRAYSVTNIMHPFVLTFPKCSLEVFRLKFCTNRSSFSVSALVDLITVMLLGNE